MGAAATVPALILALLPGCRPATMEGCARLPGAAAREDCRFRVASESTGDRGALDAAIGAVAEPSSRDLLLLRLAIADPARAGDLCARTVTPGAQDKCRQVLGRPHLGTVPKPPLAGGEPEGGRGPPLGRVTP